MDHAASTEVLSYKYRQGTAKRKKYHEYSNDMKSPGVQVYNGLSLKIVEAVEVWICTSAASNIGNITFWNPLVCESTPTWNNMNLADSRMTICTNKVIAATKPLYIIL